jgi:putative DNA primase/helicase
MIILTTLTPPENRVNDPNICDKFIAEKEKIFCWMFDGLRRLISNNFRFTISEKAKLNVKETVEDSCNIIEFLGDADRIIRGENLSVSSHELYNCYYSWCEENALLAMKSQSFSAWLKKNAETADVKFSYHVNYNGHRVRGFTGIAVKHNTTAF